MEALYILVGVLAAAVVFLTILLLRRSARPETQGQIPLMQQQLEALRSQMGQSITGLTGNVSNQMSSTTEHLARRLEGVAAQMAQLSDSLNKQLSAINANVSERIDKQTGIFGDVKEKVGAFEESMKLVVQLRDEIAELQNIFAAPKLRGEFGEDSLNELLAGRLPADRFALQFPLGAEKVDAAILLEDCIIPIDAKFPLDNFRRVAACQDPDGEEARRAKSEFSRNVKKHIDDIAMKYIRPDAKTLDFALMYIPAESVYHQLLLQNDLQISGQTVMQYAAGRNVIAVSPNSLYAYLQTILMGLRRMQIERHAHEVLRNQERWAKDIIRFSREFTVLGGHLRNSQTKYEEAVRYLDRLVSQFEMLSGAGASEIEGGGQKPLPSGPQPPQDAAGNS